MYCTVYLYSYSFFLFIHTRVPQPYPYRTRTVPVPYKRRPPPPWRQTQGGRDRGDLEEEEREAIADSLNGDIGGTGGGVGRCDDTGDGNDTGDGSGAPGGASARVWVCGYCTEEHVLLREERGERLKHTHYYRLFLLFVVIHTSRIVSNRKKKKRFLFDT